MRYAAGGRIIPSVVGTLVDEYSEQAEGDHALFTGYDHFIAAQGVDVLTFLQTATRRSRRLSVKKNK